MKSKVQNYWWKTKTFKIGLGVFIVIAILVAVLFGDQISQLLDLFGSRAGTANVLTIDDNPATGIPGHGYLDAGTYSPDEIKYVGPIDSNTGEGYITLP